MCSSSKAKHFDVFQSSCPYYESKVTELIQKANKLRLQRDVAVLLLQAGPLLATQSLQVFAQAAARVLRVDDVVNKTTLGGALQNERRGADKFEMNVRSAA